MVSLIPIYSHIDFANSMAAAVSKGNLIIVNLLLDMRPFN